MQSPAPSSLLSLEKELYAGNNHLFLLYVVSFRGLGPQWKEACGGPVLPGD